MREAVPFLKNLLPAVLHERIALVGGFVRDMLLDKESQDCDLVAALSHDELSGLGFRLVEAKSSATIYFRHHGNFGKIEAIRVNGMSELEADLIRRDFTANAIAMNLDGRLFDPLGGEDDLKNRRLRACSSRSFQADPLRIFRGFRFEAHGWRMTPETDELIRAGDWAGAFQSMPVERFSSEMLKALTGEMPALFFQQMLEYEVCGEFLPELFRMSRVPAGPLEHHPEGDLFTHSVQVLQRVAEETNDPLARFCAFFHDIGKLSTSPALYPKHHGHDDAGFEMAEKFCNRLCLPARYRKALAWVSRLHGKANRWDELRDSTKIKTAEQAIKSGAVEILPLVSVADKPGSRSVAGWDDAVGIARLTIRELGIDQGRLEMMPIKSRSAYILQMRVDALRRASIQHAVRPLP